MSAALEQGTALARAAEAERLEPAQGDEAEAVVELGDVDVGRRRSVRSHIIAAASRSAMVVRSSNWSHDGRPCSAVPMASMRTGGLRRSGAASARDTMIAVEPSAGTSQS